MLFKQQTKNILFLVLLLSLSLWFTPVNAQTVFYRYKDANGVLVLSNSIPPEYAKKGYKIVDAYGRVIKDVPPALTPEQIAEKKRLEAEKARLAEEARKQKEADTLLLRLYSHPDDAIRARDRKLQEIDILTQQKTNTKKSVQNKIIELESQAANAERAGKKVPERVLNEIVDLQDEVARLDKDLVNLAESRSQEVTEYEAAIERLKVLIQR